MATQNHAGTAMVALVPPYETSEDLLELAGRDTADLDDQHITVVYLPSTEGFTAEDLVGAVQDFADMGDSLSGVPNGWGRFATEDGSCQIALWDIVGWSAFRERLVAALGARGIVWEDNHGSIPHQTMGYDAPDVMAPATAFPKVDPVIFGDIHVWYDDEHVAAIELASPPLDVVASLLLPSAVEAALRRVAKDDVWDHEDEAKHPRGNPGNAGQFRKKDGPAAAPKKKDEKAKSEPKKDEPTKGPDAGAKEPDAPKPKPKGKPFLPSNKTIADRIRRRVEEAKAKGKSKEIPVYDGPPPERTGFVEDDPRSEEEAKERGDVYGEYLPAGEYPEGDPRNDPEFLTQHEEARALTSRYVNPSIEDIENGIGGDTEILYNDIYDPETGDTTAYNMERSKTHLAVVRRVMDEAEKKGVPKSGKMLIMAGPSGAGKSSFINQYGKEKFGIEGEKPADDPDNFVVINPDNFKDDVEVDPSRYPGLNENELAAIKHEESSHLAQLAARQVIAAGYDVIIDITLGKASSAERKYLDIPGAEQYDDVQVALVDGDMARSRHNAGNRWKKPDKKGGTWKRQWDGRFIDMGLVESQKPTKEGYRSKNAEQFEDLTTRRTDRVKKAWVFDPFDNSVKESKAPKHEGLDHREARLSARLRSLLVESVNDMMIIDKDGYSNERIALMDGSKKNVQYWIDQYKNKGISEDELVKGLTEDVKYENKPVSPYQKGTPEWYEWVEEQSDPEGSISALVGQIPDEAYLRVVDIIHKRAQ